MRLTIQTTVESEQIEPLLRFLKSLKLPAHALSDVAIKGRHRMLSPMKGCGVLKTEIVLLKEPELLELMK